MTPQPDSPLDEGRRWLALAEGDLDAARFLFGHEAAALRNVGFLAQQAAEKALKALLAAHDEPIPRLHDLGRLLALVPEPRPSIDSEQLGRLSPWAVHGRYDMDVMPLEREAAASLLEVAGGAVRAATGILESMSTSEPGKSCAAEEPLPSSTDE